jgi:hypothetical protein
LAALALEHGLTLRGWGYRAIRALRQRGADEISKQTHFDIDTRFS